MIELVYFITNGDVDVDMVDAMVKKGWVILCVQKAKRIHPHALDTDNIAIFGRYCENKPENH